MSSFWSSFLTIFKAKGKKPSGHTYGTLIKAFGAMGKMAECRKLWDEMTDGRTVEPNQIVFGCMIDALVVNERLTDAVEFFKAWKDQLGANAVMHSSLIQGCARSRDTAAAMEMHHHVLAAVVDTKGGGEKSADPGGAVRRVWCSSCCCAVLPCCLCLCCYVAV